MKIVVFGASGNVGRTVVSELLKNYEVTAFVFGTSPFTTHERLKVIQGDVKVLADVIVATQQADVVISTLGSWGTQTKDILASGMQNIILAMNKRGIKRIVSLTGADARFTDDSLPVLNRLSRTLFGVFAGKILKDGEEHIRSLTASNLDWTVLRSPVMNEKGSVDFILNNTFSKPWQTIHRTAVAHAMVDLVETDTFYKECPIIHRS